MLASTIKLLASPWQLYVTAMLTSRNNFIYDLLLIITKMTMVMMINVVVLMRSWRLLMDRRRPMISRRHNKTHIHEGRGLGTDCPPRLALPRPPAVSMQWLVTCYVCDDTLLTTLCVLLLDCTLFCMILRERLVRVATGNISVIVVVVAIHFSRILSKCTCSRCLFVWTRLVIVAMDRQGAM